MIVHVLNIRPFSQFYLLWNKEYVRIQCEKWATEEAYHLNLALGSRWISSSLPTPGTS